MDTNSISNWIYLTYQLGFLWVQQCSHLGSKSEFRLESKCPEPNFGSFFADFGLDEYDFGSRFGQMSNTKRNVPEKYSDRIREKVSEIGHIPEFLFGEFRTTGKNFDFSGLGPHFWPKCEHWSSHTQANLLNFFLDKKVQLSDLIHMLMVNNYGDGFVFFWSTTP